MIARGEWNIVASAGSLVRPGGTIVRPGKAQHPEEASCAREILLPLDAHRFLVKNIRESG
jgi:hypothetical protein